MLQLAHWLHNDGDIKRNVNKKKQKMPCSDLDIKLKKDDPYIEAKQKNTKKRCENCTTFAYCKHTHDFGGVDELYQWNQRKRKLDRLENI